jgi:hypothetical protein
MIYKVNKFYSEPEYFDDSTNPNAKTDAEALLAQVRFEVLAKEAVRFSICATFVNGPDTIWREVLDTDPEETVCKVFDTFTGQYTEVSTKTKAFALNEEKKQYFLTNCGLNAVEKLEKMPEITQPTTQGTQNL